MTWSRDTVLDAIRRLRTFGHGSSKAPHKPLLLLLALARLQREESRWYPFVLADEELSRLLRLYNPTKAVTTWYPFWRLRNDHRGTLWQIRGNESIKAALDAGAPDRSKAQLIQGGAEGAFPTGLQDYLVSHPSVVNDAVVLILELYIRPTYHDDLLNEVGLPYVHEFDLPSSERARRDPKFRGVVLQAYNYMCAMCGYDGRIGEQSLGVEAAHIKMHARGGPDSVNNGLSLCCFHHKVFDTPGALCISDDFRIIIPSSVNWRGGVGEKLLALDGHPISLPRSAGKHPSLEFIRWHREDSLGD